MSQEPAKERVLVTGAGGFIGSAVTEQLASEGYEVHGASRSAPEMDALHKNHRLDVLDAGATEALMREVRPSHLVHMAWTTAHGTYWTDEANLDWMAATLSLVRAFDRSGGARAVLIGSCTEYDWSIPGAFQEERPGFPPGTFYGASKLATGLAACAFGETITAEVAWGRIFHLYGPGEDARRIVPQLIDAARRDEPLELRQPRNRIDYLHVNDVAGAIGAILASGLTGPCNIASGEGVTPAEIGDIIGELAGRPCYDTPDVIEGTPLEVIADVTRLRDEVGFVPRWNIQEGLRETREWFLTREKGTSA